MIPTAPPYHVLALSPPCAVPIPVVGLAGVWGHCGQALMASPPLLVAGKAPEDVVRRYIQKVKNPPDEVSGGSGAAGGSWGSGDSQRAGDNVPIPPCAPQDCTICMERLVTSSGYEGVLSQRGIKPELVGKLGKCGHMYHLLCLLAMYNNGNKVSWDPPGGHRPRGHASPGWVLGPGCCP